MSNNNNNDALSTVRFEIRVTEAVLEDLAASLERVRGLHSRARNAAADAADAGDDAAYIRETRAAEAYDVEHDLLHRRMVDAVGTLGSLRFRVLTRAGSAR